MSQDFASLPHPGLKTCISPPSRSCPTCIQVARFASRLPACCISPLYMSLLNSIKVPIFSSNLHPCWISPPSGSEELRFHPGPIPPISRSPDVSHLHLGPVSLPCRSRYSRLTSIQVTSQLPSRSRQLHISSIQVPSHYQPRPDNHVSSPARSRYSCLTIQFTSHPIYIPQNASHVHPGPISSHPGPNVCVSPPSRPHLTPIHIARFASHPHPGSTSSASRSQDLHLTFISVMSPLLSVRQDCNSPASRSHLTPSRFLNLCLTSIQYMTHLHPGPWIHISPPTCCVQVSRISLHLHPAPISAPYTSQNVRLTSIQVSSHLSPDPKIRVSPPSRSVHPGCVLPPCRSWELYFSSMGVSSHPHRSLKFCTSPPSRSFLNPKQLLRFAPHLYPGPVLLCPDT